MTHANFIALAEQASKIAAQLTKGTPNDPKEARMSDEVSGAALESKAKELDLRLKELDIEKREYEQRTRPGPYKAALTNPAVIAAAVAAWASLTAAGVTWLSGQITAASQLEKAEIEAKKALESQKQEAVLRAEADRRRFEANLILEMIKTGDPDHARKNLEFLAQSGLLSGDIGERIRRATGVPQLPNPPHQ